MQNKIKVVIPCAGKGSRSGLNYPKSLFEINNVPILLNIVNLVKHIDNSPIVIINPSNINLFNDFKNKYSLKLNFIFQDKPLGMGHAISCVKNFKNLYQYQNILTLWGDQPFIKKETIDSVLSSYITDKCFFAFPTINTINPYTILNRDNHNNPVELLETKNSNHIPKYGERDAGIFIFKNKIINFLYDNLNQFYDDKSNEISFLKIVNFLYQKNYKVRAYRIAHESDIIGFNSLNDIQGYL